RRFRDARRERSVEHDNETDGAQCRMQQRQRPRRQPSPQYERGERYAAKGTDGKNDESRAKHCNSPIAIKGHRPLDASVAWRFLGPKAFLVSVLDTSRLMLPAK